MRPDSAVNKTKTGSKKILAGAASRLLMGGAISLLGAGCAIFVTSAQPVLAQASATTSRRSFDIPAQPLTTALAQFGRQSGLQIVFPAQVSRGVRSTAVVGSFTPQQAVARLLSGTGLQWEVAGQSVIVRGTSTALASGNGTDDGSAVVDDGSSTVLDTIVIAGSRDRNAIGGEGYQGTPDWVYETPAAISVISREAIQSAAGARDPRDLLDSVAGIYVNSSSANSPAISPNIRGVQDMGRVVVSIDGARQNANRTMSSGGEDYIGSAGKAFVDPAFIRSVEVDRSTGSKAGLAGSLAGAVTFRTVSADDLIQPGRDWGMETNTTFGTNGQHFTGSVLGAARIKDTPFSVVAGLSRQNLGDYKIGRHGTVEWSGNNADMGESWLMGRDNWSSLLKLEGDFGDVKTSLAWTHQDKEFSWSQGAGDTTARSDERALVDTVTASLDWNPADNDLIDLRSKIWLNSTREDTLRHARGSWPISGYPDTDISADYLSFGFSVDNTSRFDTKLGAVKLNYGVEAFRDISKSSASSEAITAWPELESNFTSFSPAGRRDMASAFMSGDWEPTSWVTLSAGLRYDWYRLKGSPTYYSYQEAQDYTASCVMTQYDYRLAYDPSFDPSTQLASVIRRLQSYCGEAYDGEFYREGYTIDALSTPVSYPGTTLDIDRSGGAWLPSASIEFKPVDWFRPYVSYSQSYRPPTTAEAFFTGALPGATQPGIGFAPNELLEPETAETWEIGANFSLDNVFTERDSLRLKMSAFSRTIEDYIVLGYFYTSATSRQYTGYVNTVDDTHMRGVEIEGNYDTGRFWIGGSATWLDNDWAQKVQGTWYGQNTQSNNVQMYAAYVPPKFKATLDAGVRFFEERLAVGARVTHSTPTLTQVETISADGGTYLSNEYTKLDLYSIYKINDNMTLRVSVDNVTDINHVPAGSRYPSPGRTFFASLQTRW